MSMRAMSMSMRSTTMRMRRRSGRGARRIVGRRARSFERVWVVVFEGIRTSLCSSLDPLSFGIIIVELGCRRRRHSTS